MEPFVGGHEVEVVTEEMLRPAAGPRASCDASGDPGADERLHQVSDALAAELPYPLRSIQHHVGAHQGEARRVTPVVLPRHLVGELPVLDCSKLRNEVATT